MHLLRLAPNVPPTGLGLSANVIAENVATGTGIGTFSIADPDGDVAFTYSLVSGTGSADNAAFTIFGNTLQSNAVFNFETKNSYSIRVRTTDTGVPSLLGRADVHDQRDERE